MPDRRTRAATPRDVQGAHRVDDNGHALGMTTVPTAFVLVGAFLHVVRDLPGHLDLDPSRDVRGPV
jgi:hypothetical protein